MARKKERERDLKSPKATSPQKNRFLLTRSIRNPRSTDVESAAAAPGATPANAAGAMVDEPSAAAVARDAEERLLAQQSALYMQAQNARALGSEDILRSSTTS